MSWQKPFHNGLKSYSRNSKRKGNRHGKEEKKQNHSRRLKPRDQRGAGAGKPKAGISVSSVKAKTNPISGATPTNTKGNAMTREDRIAALHKAADQRILLLDGAMGTMIQRYKLQEEDYRGERFKDWPSDVKGNNDLLVLTKPDVISEIHASYLEAGSDIFETNTFNGTTIAMADYGMEELAYEINVEAAKLARKVADEFTAKTPDKPRWVAGAVGPTNRSASISPDVNDPGYRNVTFDELVTAYGAQVEGLIEGGVDIIMIETIFDTLNAKAAGFATLEVFEKLGITLPIIISGTATDMSGRNLSGQTPEAFFYSMRHLRPFAIGLNCAFGAEDMRPLITEIAAVSDFRLSAYPNAGLPNEMGEFDQTAEEMSALLEGWAKDGLINLVGGCCGSSPDHIAAIAKAVAGYPPRKIPDVPVKTRLSGQSPFVMG